MSKKEKFSDLFVGCVVRHIPTGIVSKIIDLRLVDGHPVDQKIELGGVDNSLYFDLEIVSKDKFKCQQCGSTSLLQLDSDDPNIYIDCNPERELEPLGDIKLLAGRSFPYTMVICPKCGQIQGEWPVQLNILEYENAVRLKEKYNLSR